MNAVPDTLTHRLANAAWGAILNERDALESTAGNVRGLTVELVIGANGAVSEAVAFVERRAKGPSLLGRYDYVRGGKTS